MTNVVSMESKLEELERRLQSAETYYSDKLYDYEFAKLKLEDAAESLRKAIVALEKYV